MTSPSALFSHTRQIVGRNNVFGQPGLVLVCFGLDDCHSRPDWLTQKHCGEIA
jgi:hypothetical protein